MLKQLLRIYYLIWGSITHPKAVYFCKSGLWLWYKGDEVLWLWTWRPPNKYMSNGKRYCWISTLASGTGEFGDAGYQSLKEMDEFWKEYDNATNPVGSL